MRTKNARAIDGDEAAWIADVKSVDGWYASRFDKNAGRDRVNVKCVICGRDMWLPKCKSVNYKTCGGECAVTFKKKNVVARIRSCETCGKCFIPRAIQVAKGNGRFCSNACNTVGIAAARAAISKSIATLKEMRANGMINYRRGENNHRWSGGPEALRIRGIRKATEYRKNNLTKVRAWEHNCRVRRRQAGKLPTDCVDRLLALQKRRCAACHKKLVKYHLDHIVALAKGGRNEFNNVQLLCPSCNLHKSDKDPIIYMQSVGFLL